MPNGTQYGQIATTYGGPWVDQVLTNLGAPLTDSNRAALRAWAASEGTVSSNNPLAFSGTYPGATTCLAQCGTSSPIMAYGSSQQGAANTSAFILNNSSYGAIVSAFRQDVGLSGIFGAINGSPWCSGCQSGKYPTVLSSVVGGGSGQTAPPPGSRAPSNAPSTAPDPTRCIVNLPVVGCVVNYQQALKIKGWSLMIGGAVVAVVGLGVVIAAMGLESKAARVIGQANPAIRAGRSVTQTAQGAVGSARTQSRARSTERRQDRTDREIEDRFTETRRQDPDAFTRQGRQARAQRARRGESVEAARVRRRQPRRESPRPTRSVVYGEGFEG